MAIIIITSIILYILMILWSYHNLEDVDKSKKILYIAIEAIFTIIITYITFNISQKIIEYPNEEILETIKISLICVFTGINGCIIMPYISKIIGKIDGRDIEQKELLIRIGILILIIILILVIESNYMSSTQNGILKYLENLQNSQ